MTDGTARAAGGGTGTPGRQRTPGTPGGFPEAAGAGVPVGEGGPEVPDAPVGPDTAGASRAAGGPDAARVPAGSAGPDVPHGPDPAGGSGSSGGPGASGGTGVFGGSPAPPGSPPPRRRGRPARADRDAGPGARDRILQAARREFAERGYDRTTMRGIARSAGVDAALVHHYFGTKDEVFAAAIEVSFEPVLVLPAILGGSRDGIGERLARFFFAVWENPASRTPLLAIVRSALTHDAAATVLSTFVLRRLLGKIAAELDVPDPEFRAELATSQMIGVAILRYVIRVQPLAAADPEEIVAMVAPTIQRYLTEPGPLP
jgi:AcrR family transcriptional regulator